MSGYELLDCGAGRKLEQVGPYRLDRQAPQAVWPPALEREVWDHAQGVHVRDDRGGGHWEFRERLPKSWNIELEELSLRVKPTPFGHLGLFVEQRAGWHFVAERVRRRRESGSPCEVLNLFSYTGIASLIAARAGARVCHVDAAKGIVDWARHNAADSGLDSRPIRWIVEDALRFCERERRRERRYDGIILDPPTYGRGSGGQVWRIEDDLPPLLEVLNDLLSPDPDFLLLSAHTPGFTATVFENLARRTMPGLANWTMAGGEMTTPARSGLSLPAGHDLRATPPARPHA